MTEPANLDPKVPRTPFAGKLWPIPWLMWRERPGSEGCGALIELNDRMVAAIAASDTPTQPGEARTARQRAICADVFHNLPNEDFERLAIGAVFAGLKAAHPSLTREEFDGWPASEAELLIAWLTVRRQSGIWPYA